MATKKSRTRKAAKRMKRKPATRKSTARTAAARKSAARKSVARKSAGRKSASRKSAGRKPASRKSGGRSSTTKPKRRRRVLAAVESTARQGLGVARAGLERLKESTVTLIGDVKERITGTDETPPATRSAEVDGGPRS